MNMRSVILAVILATMTVGTAFAQAPATLLLRSGDRVIGLLSGFRSSQATVLVGGRQQRIPASEITLIDFDGPAMPQPAQLDTLWRPGLHLVVLANGATLGGEVIDISGARPLVITIRSGGRDRQLSATEVSEIFLTRPPSQQLDQVLWNRRDRTPGRNDAQGRGNGRARGNTQGHEFQVLARQSWIPTGIVVRQGQTTQFDATGEVTLNQNGSLRARPAGAANSQFDRNAPLPSVTVGALIGRIDSGGRGGRAFVIGDRASVVMPADGELFLGVNDSNFNDNGGAFTVRIDMAGQAGGFGPGDGQVREFQVSSRQPWSQTGITVRQGEVIKFEATGEVTLNQNGSLKARSSGATNHQVDRDAPLSTVPVGALIGRIDNASRPGQGSTRTFLIGDQPSIVMPFDGELLLGVNDSNHDDNNGGFTVRVERLRTQPRFQ